jgi:hypothetical protein
MSAISGVFKRILGGLGILLGGAGFLVFNLLFVFAIPLNVVAYMRLFGWEIWTAIISAILISIIPALGQLCMFVMTFVGAYFVVAAHFNFKEAVVPPPMEVVRTADLTSEQFARLRAKMRPQVEAYCLRESETRYAIDGKLPSFVSDFCSCAASAAVTAMTKDDLDDPQHPSLAFRTRLKQAMTDNCRGA